MEGLAGYSPETEKSPTPIEKIDRIFESSNQEAKRKIAEATGKFYKAAVGTYLREGDLPEKRERVVEMIDNLPGPMRKLYGQAFEIFHRELERNKEMLGDDPAVEKSLLLSIAIMQSEKERMEALRNSDQDSPPVDIDMESKTAIVSNRFGEVTLFEPTPGLAILEVPPDLYQIIRNQHPEDTHGEYAVTISGERIPTFIVTQTPSQEKLNPHHRLSPEKIERHETHHFMWDFLNRSQFIPEPNEENFERISAFSSFRNELAAYLNQDWRSLTHQPIKSLVYDAPPKIQEEAAQLRDLALLCQELAALKKIPREAFVYPVMVAKSFRDLEGRLLEMAPGPNELDLRSIILVIGDNLFIKGALLVGKDRESKSMVEAAKLYFKVKGIEMSQEEIEKFARDQVDFSPGQSKVIADLLSPNEEPNIPLAA